MRGLGAVALTILLSLGAGHIIIDHVDGDMLIGFVDNIGDYNGSFFSRIQNTMTFLYTVTNQSLWPPGVEIGYVIYSSEEECDNCEFKTDALGLLFDLLNRFPKIVAIVGFRSLTQSLQIISFASSIRLPVYTYASGVILDNLLDYQHRSYVTRITSYRTVQVNSTIPDVLKQLGVNIVSVVYDKSKLEQFGKLTQEFELAETYNIEVEYKGHFEYNTKTSGNDLSSGSGLRAQLLGPANDTRVQTVVVLLSTGNRNKFLRDLRVNRTHGDKSTDLLLVFDSSSCILDYEDNEDYKALLDEKTYAIRICQTNYDVPGLMQYMANYVLYSGNGNVTANSEVLSTWYTGNFNAFNNTCVGSKSSCDPNENFTKAITSVDHLANKENSRYNHRIYYTLLKVLRSLENVTTEQVESVRNRTFADLINGPNDVGELIYTGFKASNVDLPDDTNFLRFNTNTTPHWANDYEVIFELWNGSSNSIIWNSVDKAKFYSFMEKVKLEIVPTSSDKHMECSIGCISGSRKVQDDKLVNCWTCEKCTGNTFNKHGDLSSCKACPSNDTSNMMYANDNRTECNKPARSVNITTTAGKIVWIMTSVNMCILMLTAGVYLKYWKSRVIVSSGRDLMTFMFVGILIGHIEALLIAMVPSRNVCVAIQILAHLFMVLTVCPLLVKTLRIWFVFKYSVKLGKKVKDYITDWMIMLQLGVLALPHFIFLVLGLSLGDSHRFKVNYVVESLDPNVVVTMSCGPANFTIMLSSIIYTGLLLVVSTVLGWSTRKLPDNFKESMHIFLSSLISLLLVSVYVPAMLTMAGFTQVALLAAVITIISATLTTVMFMPKAYVVLFVPIIKQKLMFKSTNRSHSDAPRENHDGNSPVPV